MAYTYSSSTNGAFEEFLERCARTDPRRAESLLDLLERFIVSEGRSGTWLRGDATRSASVVPQSDRLAAIGGWALLIIVEDGAVVEVQPWDGDELLARWSHVLASLERRFGL